MRSRFGTQVRDSVWLLCVWGGGKVGGRYRGAFFMLLFETNVARGKLWYDNCFSPADKEKTIFSIMIGNA